LNRQNDLLEQIEHYRQLTQRYRTLDQQIDDLLKRTRVAGDIDTLHHVDREAYRSLARQRDEIINEMRRMEQFLFAEDDL